MKSFFSEPQTVFFRFQVLRGSTLWAFVTCLSVLGLAFGLRPLGSAATENEKEVIHLFNGQDLTNFYTFLVEPAKGQPRYGKNNDPEKVFTVHDGMIHVSGKVYGCFTTEKEFENYHLLVEFKWGEKTWGNREKAARDSGVLLHCTGEDGSFGAWMEAFECQMIEGGTGDLLILGGKTKRSLTVEAEKRDGQHYFKPGSPAVTLPSGRFNWYGRDPKWKEIGRAHV